MAPVETVVEDRPPLATGIIDENDADVLMAVKALGDMRSQGAAPALSSPPTAQHAADSGATPAIPRSADFANNASELSISSPLLDGDLSNADFVSRVSTLPLVTSVLSAYSQSKASSRVVKYGAQMVESSVKTIGKPVMDRLPTAQLDEFACRQLDKLEQRYSARTDSPRDEAPHTPTPRSQTTQEADPGPERGRSLERRTSAPANGATPLRSPVQSEARGDSVPRHDAGSGVVTSSSGDSDRQVANRSRWQAMLLEAGGIGAALSDESMKRLKYCLQWLQYATNRIDSQIAVLREFLDSLSPGAGTSDALLPLPLDQDAPVSPATLARLSAVKRDVVATIRQAVDIVSRYAGGALPEPARGTVRSVLLRLPERWASAGREGPNDAPAHRRTGSGSSARMPYPPRSTTPADNISAARPGPHTQPTAGAAAQAAQRVMTLATESLDMMRGVTGVVKDSLDRAEIWVDRLRVVGLQRGDQGAEESLTALDASFHSGIPGTPALTSGSGSPRSLSMAVPLSPVSFSHSFSQSRTQPHSAFSSYPSSKAASTAGSDTEMDGGEDVKPTLGPARKKRRKGGGRTAKRHKDMDVDNDGDLKPSPMKNSANN